MGVLREQVFMQASIELQREQLGLPSDLEIRLSAKINAGKFNRRRYPSDRLGSEYLSPQPAHSKPFVLGGNLNQPSIRDLSEQQIAFRDNINSEKHSATIQSQFDSQYSQEVPQRNHRKAIGERQAYLNSK